MTYRIFNWHDKQSGINHLSTRALFAARCIWRHVPMPLILRIPEALASASNYTRSRTGGEHNRDRISWCSAAEISTISACTDDCIIPPINAVVLSACPSYRDVLYGQCALLVSNSIRRPLADTRKRRRVSILRTGRESGMFVVNTFSKRRRRMHKGFETSNERFNPAVAKCD